MNTTNARHSVRLFSRSLCSAKCYQHNRFHIAHFICMWRNAHIGCRCEYGLMLLFFFFCSLVACAKTSHEWIERSKRRISAVSLPWTQCLDVQCLRARNSDYELSIFLLSSSMLLLLLQKSKTSERTLCADRIFTSVTWIREYIHAKWSHLFLMRARLYHYIKCMVNGSA